MRCRRFRFHAQRLGTWLGNGFRRNLCRRCLGCRARAHPIVGARDQRRVRRYGNLWPAFIADDFRRSRFPKVYRDGRLRRVRLLHLFLDPAPMVFSLFVTLIMTRCVAFLMRRGDIRCGPGFELAGEVVGRHAGSFETVYLRRRFNLFPFRCGFILFVRRLRFVPEHLLKGQGRVGRIDIEYVRWRGVRFRLGFSRGECRRGLRGCSSHVFGAQLLGFF